jgi:hypothetical protein
MPHHSRNINPAYLRLETSTLAPSRQTLKDGMLALFMKYAYRTGVPQIAREMS